MVIMFSTIIIIIKLSGADYKINALSIVIKLGRNNAMPMLPMLPMVPGRYAPFAQLTTRRIAFH